MRDYKRCCVVCLAERQVSVEQSIEIKAMMGTYQIILPICDEHREKSDEAFVSAVVYERANPAKWITSGKWH